jgi:heptosyltransferase-2
MDHQEKVLIIKTGYGEVLDNSYDSRKVSLGDVLRTTPILHAYKKADLTWVTDAEAMPLLRNNPYIRRLVPLDFTNAMHLLDENDFDSVINLEKNHDICKFVNNINAWRKYGFRFDKKTGTTQAYDRASEILTVSVDSKLKKENKRTFQELLFEMIGEKWNGEEYILGYEPKTKEEYDLALNTKVGQKWPTKAWPMENWDNLEKMLKKDGLKVTRQDKQPEKVLKDLESYMDWINSAKLIVSNDSLGLHLGLAMDKKVLGLFGATPSPEVYFYNRGKAILPEPSPECMPCFKSICKRGRNCIEEINPEKVYKSIKEELK